MVTFRMTTYNQKNKQNVRRAWKCMRCPEDSAFIGQRFRVETHILREHLTPEFESFFMLIVQVCMPKI